MNESPIRKFCESRHRKLIVAIVTTLLGLLVLFPLVDDYFDNQESHSTLTEDIDRARETADALPELEKQVSEINEKLAAIESRSVSGETASEYRSKVVDLVRASSCQVRRFDIGTATLRPWLQDDNPLLTTNRQEKKKAKTPFALEKRNVVLLVDGSMENLRQLLKKIHDDDSLAYLNRLELQSTSQRSDQVTLEIELWLFALGRQNA